MQAQYAASGTPTLFFTNMLVFFWALVTNPDTIWTNREAAIKPFHSFWRTTMKSMKNKKQETKVKKQSKENKVAVAAPKTQKAEKPEAEPKRTIKQVVIETIAANSVATNDEMIAAVKATFPKSAFDDRHAAWYRSQARKGLLTGTPITIPAMGRKQFQTAN